MKDPAYADLRKALAEPEQPLTLSPELVRALFRIKGKGSINLTNRRARTRLAKKKAQAAHLKRERTK